MVYLIQQILICLIAAVLLGFLLGWLFKRVFGQERDTIESLQVQLQSQERAQTQSQVRISELQGEITDAEDRLDRQAREIGESAATAERLAAKVEDLEPLEADLIRTRGVLVKANDGLSRYKKTLDAETVKRQRYEAEAKVLRSRVDKLMPLRAQFTELSETNSLQIEELRGVRDQLAAVDELRSQYDSAQRRLQELETENVTLGQKLVALNQIEVQQRERAEGAEAAVSKAQAELSILKARIDALEPKAVEAAKLELALQAADKTNAERLAAQAADSERARLDEQARAAAQLASLEQKLQADLDQQRTDHEQSLVQVRADSEQQRQTLQANHRAALDEQVNAVKTANSDLQTQLAALTASANTEQQQAAELQSELRNTVSKQRTSLESQAQTLEEMRGENARLARDLEQLQTQFDVTSAELDSTLSEAQQHRLQNDAESQRLGAAMSEQHANIERLTTDNATLRASTEDLTAKLAQVNNEMGQVKNRADAYQPLQVKFADLQSSHETLRQHHSALQRDIAQVSALRGEITERDTAVRRLESQIRAQGLRKDDEIRQLSEQLREIEGVRLELQQARRQQRDVEKLLEENRSEAEQQRQALQQQIDQLHATSAPPQHAAAADESGSADPQTRFHEGLAAEYPAAAADAGEASAESAPLSVSEIETLKVAAAKAGDGAADIKHVRRRKFLIGVRSQQTPKRSADSDEISRLKKELAQARAKAMRADSVAAPLQRLKGRLKRAGEQDGTAPATANPTLDAPTFDAPTPAEVTEVQDSPPPGDKSPPGAVSPAEPLHTETDSDVGAVAKRNIRSALSSALSSASDLTAGPEGEAPATEDQSEAMPDRAPAQSNERSTTSARPALLFTPPEGKDDLKKIRGIGPVLESTLNDLGIRTFEQIANFSRDDIERVVDAIKIFPGRIERDDWIGGAREQFYKKYGKEV